MKATLFASLVASGLMLSAGALATSYPGPNECKLTSTQLRQNLMLVTAWAPNYDSASAALKEGMVLCGAGESAEGVALMKAAIESLGLPIMPN